MTYRNQRAQRGATKAWTRGRTWCARGLWLLAAPGGALGLGVCVAGCGAEKTLNSDDVDPEAIFASYQVGFDDEGGKVHLSAAFSLGERSGSRVVLRSPASVSVDGVNLAAGASPEVQGGALQLAAGDYALSLSRAKPPASYLFQFTRPDGKQVVNDVPVVSAVEIDSEALPPRVSRRRSLRVVFLTEEKKSEGVKVTCVLQSLNETGRDRDAPGDTDAERPPQTGATPPVGGRLGPVGSVPPGAPNGVNAPVEDQVERVGVLEEPARGGGCVFPSERLVRLVTGTARLWTRAVRESQQLPGYARGGEWRSVTASVASLVEILP